jgi:hypothetical protein
MNSQDDFPLDSFGIDPLTEQPDAQTRQKCELADLVSTVVALDHSRPIRPRSASFQAILGQISVQAPSRIKQRIFAWSGWAAAAAVTIVLLMKNPPATSDLPISTAHSNPSAADQLSRSASLPAQTDAAEKTPTLVKEERVSSQDIVAEATEMREQQRSLIQEIDTLRKQIVLLTTRDKERLVAQNGISWPIIMKLTAPGTDPLAAVIKDPVLGAMFDMNPLKTENPASSENFKAGAQASAPLPDPSLPSAVPIYDPARDSGQLLINNLNPPEEGQAYFLWVQSDQSEQPVLVGSLPDNFTSSETFDFQLGAVGIIPDRFLITQDLQQAPSPPNTSNTVLLGPE